MDSPGRTLPPAVDTVTSSCAGVIVVLPPGARSSRVAAVAAPPAAAAATDGERSFNPRAELHGVLPSRSSYDGGSGRESVPPTGTRPAVSQWRTAAGSVDGQESRRQRVSAVTSTPSFESNEPPMKRTSVTTPLQQRGETDGVAADRSSRRSADVGREGRFSSPARRASGGADGGSGGATKVAPAASTPVPFTSARVVTVLPKQQ